MNRIESTLLELLSPTDLSKLLGIKSKGYIVRMLRKAGLKPIRIGHRSIRFRRSDIDAYLRSKELKIGD